MEAHSVLHPSADALRAFALGKLNDATAAVVMNHLDNCPDCCKQVAALSGDDFLDRLRHAHGRSSTPAPAESLAEVAHVEKLPAGQTPIPHLPPELANNPHYEILGELGRGGMGVVYLAKNKLMDRPEVLKVVNKALLDQPGAVERFLREIRSAAKLSHANVVTAYHALQVGDLLAFAMEYVEGPDLASLVKSQGPLPIAHACFYIQQAALGLHHAYEKQMVHRDIKPQNLILAREGKKHVVKVLDFGLAKVMREKTDDTGLTGEGKMLGTPDYIAPEQTLDAAKADIRADIYSLGCTLYFLVSGRPPFRANSLGAMLLAHQMQEAKPLNLVRPEVPEELAAVVRRMMAKSPAQRYQTPREVAQALSPFIKPGAAPKSAPELSVEAATPTPAAKKAVRVDQPAAKETQSEPSAVRESPSKGSMPSAEPRRSERFSEVTIGSQLGHPISNVGPRKKKTAHKHQLAAVMSQTRKKWLIGAGIGVAVLLLALLGMWASGLFVKTKEGTLVLKNVPADAEVTVDGEIVNVKWGEGGKTAQIKVRSGRHRIEATKDGITVIGEEVEIEDGKRRILTARLLPPLLPPDEKGGKKAPPTPDEANAKKHPGGAQDKVQESITNSIGMKLVLVKPGTFLMGSPADEAERRPDEDQHEVEITRPFYVGVYEVTQEQYERVIGQNPSYFSSTGGGKDKGMSATGGGKDKVKGMDTRQFPVENVSWENAVVFCRLLSTLPEEKEKERTYRLPTEAEWEYVCRGGHFFKKPSPPFYFGNSLSSTQANFNGVPYGGAAKGQFLTLTTKVGSYPPNPLGLYDLHGNVWEWCADWYDSEYYKHSPRQDPQGPKSGEHRVLRGGSWNYFGRDCRAAYRLSNPPGSRFFDYGFRVVLVVGARN